MKHYGDITKINGYEVPIVDVITGGSPCQDLSVAGKRAGLAGERSGLFMEQMKIVREMRERDRANGRAGWMVRPRYMVWENVPGAFSSGNPKGADFAAVIEEIIKVAEPGTSVSVCIPNGGWTKSGCYYAEDGSWSLAWRVHDAQFWGVPQRRKRIALVADFGGLSAPEILFERKGLSGDSEQSGEAGKETAGAAGEGVEGAICYGLDHVMLSGGTTYQGRGYYDNVSGCLKTQPHGVCETIGALSTLNNQSVLSFDPSMSRYAGTVFKDVAKTLTPGTSPGHHDAICTKEPILLESNQNHATVQTDGISTALPASMGMGGGYVPMVTAVAIGNGQLHQISMAEQVNTLDTMHDQQAVMCFQNTGQGWWNESEIGATIRTPCGGDSVKANLVSGVGSIVRRLTPLECERLQGYPDGWTDIGEWVDSKGKKHGEADSPRYKALGNSIALPFWQWMARRICAQYERPATMASLFDGIGGFPLVFQRCGAVPVWASEIEEFPIAVTKRHFPEDET